MRQKREGIFTKYFGIPSPKMNQDRLHQIYTNYLELYCLLDTTAGEIVIENNDKVEYQRGMIERINVLLVAVEIAQRDIDFAKIRMAEENYKIGLIKAKINRINQAILTGNDIVLKNCVDSMNKIIGLNKNLDGFCNLEELSSSNLFTVANYEYYEEVIRIALGELASTYSYIENHRRR